METKNTINFEDSISTAIPIWKLLNMTEKEYIKKYSQPFVLDIDTKVKKVNIVDLDNKDRK